MLQDLGKVVTPFPVLCVHLVGALDGTRQVKSLKCTLSAYYSGGFRFAYRHRGGHREDVRQQPVLDCLPFHHAVLVTMIVPSSTLAAVDHLQPACRSGMSRMAITLRMYGALLKGNSISSPMHISRIDPMMLSCAIVVFSIMFAVSELFKITVRLLPHGSRKS